MPAYRATTARSDVTLWYGPFDGRWARAIAPVAIGILLSLVALEGERRSFRALECTRPGLCTIWRGTGLLGVRATETFDPSTIASVTERRTSGKNAHLEAVLVDTRGSERVLAEGDAVPEVLARTTPFFAARGPGSLSVRAPPTLEGWMFVGVTATIAVLLGLWLGISCFRASARVRVDVLRSRGVVRVARVGLGGGRPVEVPIHDIAAIEIAHASGRHDAAARVVLACREGLDVPVVEHFLHGPSVHVAFATELREELGVPER